MISEVFHATSSLEAKIVSAKSLLQQAHEQHKDNLCLTTSFGAQSAVLLHMVSTLLPDVKILHIDTQHAHQETGQYKKDLVQLLKIEEQIITYRAGLTREQQKRLFGEPAINGLATDHYKQMNKVEPRDRAFRDLAITGWITGVQKQQSELRATHVSIEKMQFGEKFFPTLEWTSKDVFQYMKSFNLPTHPLWDKGYTTIGDDFEDPFDRVECGIHSFDPVI